MRVALIGNINNNSYLIAKFLRRKGVEADVFIYDYDYWMTAPEWEEGVFNPKLVPSVHPKWSWVPLQNSWVRPSWVKSMPPLTWHQLPYAKLDAFINRMEWQLNKKLKEHQQRIINASLGQEGLEDLDFSEASRWFDIYQWERVVAGYDVIQVISLIGVHILLKYLKKIYVVYDYGQPLRSMIWENSVRGKLLQCAYKNADWIVVTNADTKESLERLGVKHYSFIPAPVDETKFCPGDSLLRKALEAQYGRDIIILFATARQDWQEKGTDKILQAFAKLRETTHTRAVLLAASWGKDIHKARDYIKNKGLDSEVIWLEPTPRTMLVDYYRASDIVLDQFTLGTYGGKALLEAMACGKPVITYLNHQIHTWCFTEMPPVCCASNEIEIYNWLVNLLYDPPLRQEYGKRSRQWIEKYNGWEQVASSYVNLYTLLWDQKQASRGRL